MQWLFFYTTIKYFVITKHKKKFSSDWIWQRIITNVKRLGLHLREKAKDAIMNLSEDIRQQMGLNMDELNSVVYAKE